MADRGHTATVAEALLACLSHAFTTEHEEIMGLLLGDTIAGGASGEDLVTRIWIAYPQVRTDRRRDRVETSPEQMARCSAHAEKLSQVTGVRTRVVGWYHSHPHITVLPSHVDLKTQALYQMLDPNFVGLIFSVFNGDRATQMNTMQATAFRAGSVVVASPTLSPPLFSHQPVACRVVQCKGGSERSSLRDLAVVQQTLLVEEKEALDRALGSGSGGNGSSHPDPLTTLHHLGTHTSTLCAMLGVSLAPTISALEDRLQQQAVQVSQLRAMNAQLYGLLLAAEAGPESHESSS
ncbi:MAG: hypothetical protein WDW36_007238 [Sanguina aurantia]